MNNRIFKKLAISLVAVASIFALSGNNVNARARHYRYHYRTKYRIRRNRWHRYRRYRTRSRRFVWRTKKHKARRNVRRPRKYRKYKKYYRKYRKGRKYRKKHTKKSVNKNKRSKKMNNNNKKGTKPNSSKNIYNDKALYNTNNVYTGDIKYPDGSSEVIDTPQKINDNELCAELQTLNELNADRKSVNEPKLTWDPELTSIAYKRAKQLENNFSHYDNSTNSYYMDEDARSLGLNPNVVQAENISHTSSTDTASSGKTESEVGPMAADDMNLGMFNGEKGSTPSQDGGHRVNIESPQDTKVGIGVAYNPNNYTYYMAEDFGGTLFDK